ncbi:MAG: DUF4292 domain-containing protein [Myxococcaceae bacterium]
MNRALAAMFLAALLAAGCPPKRIGLGLPGEPKDAAELLALTAAAEKTVYSVKGEAKIKVDSPEGKGVVTLFMAVTHPSLIHLESLDFFGKPQAVLVSDGRDFGLYRADEGRYYRGPATAENIGRFLPVALPPGELTALMLGRAPRIPHDTAELGVDEAGKLYRVTLKKDAVTQTLVISPKNHRVVESHLTGANAYDLSFQDIEEVDRGTYPRKVVMRSPSAGATVELLYKDVAVNEAPDLTLYTLEAPENVPVVEVDEKGNPREARGP